MEIDSENEFCFTSEDEDNKELKQMKHDDSCCTMENEYKQTLYNQYKQQLMIAKQHKSPSVKKHLQQCEDYLTSQYGEKCYLARCINDILAADQSVSARSPLKFGLGKKFLYTLCFHHILFSPNDGNNLNNLPPIIEMKYGDSRSLLENCYIYRYIELLYKGMPPSACINCIDQTWRQYPFLQNLIKLSYFNELLNTHDQSHREFICNNIGYIVSVCQKELHQFIEDTLNNSWDALTSGFTTLFSLLHYSILSDYREGVTSLISLLDTIDSEIILRSIEWALRNYISRSDIYQLCSRLDKFTEWKYGPNLKVIYIYYYCKKFTQHSQTEGFQFIILHKDFILSWTEVSHVFHEKYLALLLFLLMSSDQTSDLASITLKLKQNIGQSTNIMYLFKAFLSLFKQDQCPFLSRTVEVLITCICENQPYTKLRVLLENCASLEHNYNANYVELLHHNQEFILSMAAEISSHGICREKGLYCEVILCLFYGFDTSQTENRNMSMYALNKVKENMSDHEKYCYEKCLKNPVWIRDDNPRNDHQMEDNDYLDHIIQPYRTRQNILKDCLIHLCGPKPYIHSSTSRPVNHALIKFIMNHDKEHGLLGIIETMCELDDETDGFRWLGKNDAEQMPNAVQNGLYTYVATTYGEKQVDLAKCILELNMTDKKTDCLYKLTLDFGKFLRWEKYVSIDFKDEQKRIIYQCICIIRRAKKIKNFKIDPEKYVKHFDFIHAIDIKVEKDFQSRQASFMVMFVLLLINLTSGAHHKSGKLKKYLSLKYEYDKLILYLLWCSGDVEINPGPTLKRLRHLHDSEKERNWIKEIVLILLKMFKGIPENSKPKSLWKDQLDGWPAKEPFYDPNNKSKIHNDDVKSDENLLNCLINLCEQKLIHIPGKYQREITLWKDNKKVELFEIYLCRKETEKINVALAQLQQNQDPEDMKKILKQIGIEVNPNPLIPSHNYARQKTKGETISCAKRDFAGILCKIIKGLNPDEKCDGIWKKPPQDWPPRKPFFSPNNEGGRQGKSQDTELVDNLLKFCEDEGVCIPNKYQDMAKTWKKNDKKDFCRIHIFLTNTAKIEHALKYLKIESLLFKPCIIDSLKQMGLIMDVEWWKSHDVSNQYSSLTNAHSLPPNSSTLPYNKDMPQCSKDSNCCQSDDQKSSKVNQSSTNQDASTIKSNLARQQTNSPTPTITNKSSISPETEDRKSSASESPQNLPADDNQSTDSEIVSLIISLSDDCPESKSTTETKNKKRPYQDEDEQLTKRQKLISEDTSESSKKVQSDEEQIQKLLDLPPPPMTDESAMIKMDEKDLYSVIEVLLNSENNGDKDNGDCLPSITELV